MPPFWLFFLVLIASAEFLVTPLHAAERLTFVSGDYEPYTGEALAHGGPLATIVTLAFAEVGMDVGTIFLPWKRGYNAAVNGQYDGTFPYGRSADREKDFLFSVSIYTLERRMYYRKSSGLDPDDLSTLKDKIYCKPVGFTLYRELIGMVEGGEMKVQTAPNLTSCAKMLEAGRVDLFITTPGAAHVAITKAGSKLKPQERSFGTSENYLLIAKTHPRGAELIAAFNRGLATLRTKGVWDKVLAQYEL
jgi:polar amino acid transport system substrate-binding protein